MALLFLDSFDHYTTSGQKWTNDSAVTIGAVAARHGTQGLRMIGVAPEFVRITLPPQPTWILGFGFRVNSPPGGANQFAQFMDVGTEQVSLRLRADNTIEINRNGTVLAASAKALLIGQWYYIEFKAFIDNAAGLAEVRVNEEVYATFNGDTQFTANNVANVIGLGGGTPPNPNGWDFDDVYILDGTGGAPNNDYWGDLQVSCILPDGAGFYTEWATLVGAATHWQAVNEVPPNEDTSYISDNVVDRRDTFTVQNLPIASGTINGIQILIRAREDVGGGPTIARMYRSGGVDNQGADTIVGLTYQYYVREILATDPIAAAAWTVAAINGAEFGVRVRP